MDVPDVCLEWRNLAFGVSKKFVEHTLNRAPCIIGAGIAHVIMLESGVDDRDSRFVGLLFAREHAWIGLELRIVGAKRQDPMSSTRVIDLGKVRRSHPGITICNPAGVRSRSDISRLQ